MRKLGLGTVQLGLDYGVSNREGKFPEAAVAALLAEARQAGVRIIDTASAYGDSEVVLGRNLPSGAFAVITKTIPLTAAEITSAEIERVARGFEQSLQRLRLGSIHAVLVHHADNLLCPGAAALYELLAGWQRAGLVAKIGVSAYDAVQIRQLLQRYRLDIVQVPINVFDQRLLADGTLAALQAAGVEIHARSVFLQGLLLMSEDELPDALRCFAAPLAQYRRYLKSAGCSPLEAALGFAKQVAEIDVALVGISSTAQLRECVQAYDRAAPLDLGRFASDDADLLDPRRWPARRA